MKNAVILNFVFILLISCGHSKLKTISFYQVPLACAADEEIACGSRVKPLFIETGKQKEIKESWINRSGTVIAIVWNSALSDEEKQNIMGPLFMQSEISSVFVSDIESQSRINEDFSSNIAPAQKKDQWFQGMDVDRLSMIEAHVLADTSTRFAVKAGLITDTEASLIKKEIEDYMKLELVRVRSYKDLISDETDLKWKKYGLEIYTKYVGTERAEKIRDFYIDYQKQIIKQKSCCKNDKMTTQSEITCPFCGYKKTETLPTDVCLIRYQCKSCKKEMVPKKGDCCVFCSYGDHKCPSKQ